MKDLKLVLDLEALKLNEEDKKQTVQKIINNVIQNVVLGYGQQQRGFDEKERRQYYKIADALEAAEKSNAESVTLEDDQMGFLVKCFRESKLMPNTLLRQIENLILGVENR
jgi:hypothetical protein